MKTAKLQRLLRKNSALPMVAAGMLFVLVVLGALAVPAVAGPIGAAGDIYVIGKTEIISGFGSPAVLQYDGETGDLVGPFASFVYSGFMGMAWGPNGNLYITNWVTYGNWMIQEYDGQTGAYIQDVVTHNTGDQSVAKGITFGPDGDLYRGDWYYGTITRYDGTTFAEKHVTPLSGIGTPNGMRFAPNGNLLVVSGGFNTVEEYDVRDGIITPIGTFASNPGSIQSQDLTFGPNGNLFVGLGGAGGVSEFDGVTGAPLGQFVPMDSELPNNGLAFDNFGRLLVADIHPVSRVDAYDAVTGAPMGPFLTDGFGDIGGGILSIPTIISIKPSLPPVSAEMTCLPSSGTIPFDVTFEVTMSNGQHYANYRQGYTNMGPESVKVFSWIQNLALSSQVGVNTATLFVEDVTPAPYNQPPYSPAGETDTASCTVTGSAP